MHCPRCGQEQAAGNIKFCSRCGLPLELVAEVVSNGGFLPRLSELNLKKGWFTRANGLKVAALWFLVIEMLLVPLTAVAGGDEEVAVLAILGFVGAVIIAVISLLFLKSPAKQNQTAYEASAQQLGTAQEQNQALPAAHTQPAASYTAPVESWKAADTGDLVRPGSVTEGTTRLLKKEDEEGG